MTTIDDEVRKYNLKIGFIKSDTEGHSCEVLEGGWKTIVHHRPILQIAIYHNFNELFKIHDKIASLKDYEFEFLFRKPDNFGELELFAYPKEL